MVMEENDGEDHQKAVVTAVAPPQPASAAVKSVWNIPPPLPDIVDREKSTTGGSTTVMAIHTDYWPTLGESQAQAEAKSPPPGATTQPTPAPHQEKKLSFSSSSDYVSVKRRYEKSVEAIAKLKPQLMSRKWKPLMLCCLVFEERSFLSVPPQVKLFIKIELDRIAINLSADLPMSFEDRVAAVGVATQFQEHSNEVYEMVTEETELAKTQIILARECLKDVTISRDQLKYLVMEALRGGCQGHRAELYAARVTKCLAALEGREKVGVDDLKRDVKYPSEIP